MEGEEEEVANVHLTVAKDWPTLLTIIAPRHGSRCSEIQALLVAKGLRVTLWDDANQVGRQQRLGFVKIWKQGLLLRF